METFKVNLVDLIVEGKLAEAKELIFSRLDDIAYENLQEEKVIVGSTTYVVVEEELNEASTNIVKMGRIKKIRRRIRRNAKGRIIVQKNVRKSAIKGYREIGI